MANIYYLLTEFDDKNLIGQAIKTLVESYPESKACNSHLTSLGYIKCILKNFSFYLFYSTYLITCPITTQVDYLVFTTYLCIPIPDPLP